MVTDLEFVDLLKRYKLLDDRTLESLIIGWQDGRGANDSFVDYLIDHGIVSRNYASAVQLLKRGALQQLQPRHVLSVRYAQCIQQLLHPGSPEAAPADTLPSTDSIITSRRGSIGQRAGDAPSPPAGPASALAVSRRTALALPPSPSVATSTPAPLPPPRDPVGRVAGMLHPPAPTERPPKVGDMLGKCLLTSELASGASAVVFEALHQTLQISVAVKVFRPSHPARAAHARDQFRTEARMLARLNHPNVVRILDFEEEPHLFLILEFINGYSLSDLLSGSGHLAIPQAVEIARKTADALAFAHHEGMVHRDVKPANIMLDRAGNVKLADLGIARLSDAILADADHPPDTLCGTPAYVAPEQAFDPAAADARSDIYSLGATLYQTLTGVLPFEATNARDMVLRHVSGKLLAPRVLRPEIPEALSALIVHMMAKRPEDRPATMRQVLDHLQVIAEACAKPKRDDPLHRPESGGQKRTAGTVSTILRRSLALLRRSGSDTTDK